MRFLFLIFLIFPNFLFACDQLALIEAIEEGNIYMIRHIPDFQNIVNSRLHRLPSRDKSEKRVPDFPVEFAVYLGNKNTVRALIGLGGELNPKDHPMPPLHVAVQSNNPDLFKILLKLGADKNLTNCFGKTPLELAQELQSQEMIDILLSPTLFKKKVPEKIDYFSLLSAYLLDRIGYILFGINLGEYS